VLSSLLSFWHYSQSSITDNTHRSFLKAFQAQKEENWALPVLKAVTLDLRLFATKAEAQKAGRGHSKPGELLEKAADHIMSCFRVCVSDMRTSEELTKRWGTLALVNQLFKIYFKIDKLPLCKPLVRAIDSSSLKDRFSLAQMVTYRFFVGRKAMFDSEFKTAASYLQFAFDNCYATSLNNKRLILIYLIPVKMLLVILRAYAPTLPSHLITVPHVYTHTLYPVALRLVGRVSYKYLPNICNL
jgi:hypothetical protein